MTPHIKSSQTSLKLVSDTSVVVGDDNVPKMPQQCALRAAMAKATTRAEVAALYNLIPPLSSRSPSALNPF